MLIITVQTIMGITLFIMYTNKLKPGSISKP